jgi:hypothetical protein
MNTYPQQIAFDRQELFLIRFDVLTPLTENHSFLDRDTVIDRDQSSKDKSDFFIFSDKD